MKPASGNYYLKQKFNLVEKKHLVLNGEKFVTHFFLKLMRVNSSLKNPFSLIYIIPHLV